MNNKSQWLAEILYGCIVNDGLTIKRPKNASVDRELREMIAENVVRRKALIINSGNGYYVPSAEDLPLIREYIAKERARAKAITEKVDAVEEMLDELIKKALPEGSTTKTTYIVDENQGESNGYMEN